MSSYDKHGRPIPLSRRGYATQWHPSVLKVEEERQAIQDTTNLLTIALCALCSAGLGIGWLVALLIEAFTK